MIQLFLEFVDVCEVVLKKALDRALFVPQVSVHLFHELFHLLLIVRRNLGHLEILIHFFDQF